MGERSETVRPARLHYASDGESDAHAAAALHPERPARRLSAESGLHAAGVPLERVGVREATDAELLRVHTARHLEAVRRAAARAEFLDGDTYLTRASERVARRAAGTALALLDELLADRATRAMLLSRPPGHHATRDAAMGFCLYNHAAVAAAHALACGVPRVAILDWDVHHGNGTQACFEADPRVLYLSLHQAPLYPGTGAVGEVGIGEGEGYTVNIPLQGGAGPPVYRAAFERIVVPVLTQFDAGLLIVSAGYDAHAADPLGGMLLDDDTFGWMTAAALGASPSECVHRALFVLEGGYALSGLEGGVCATVRSMDRPGAVRPSGDELSPPRVAELERARASARHHGWL